MLVQLLPSISPLMPGCRLKLTNLKPDYLDIILKSLKGHRDFAVVLLNRSGDEPALFNAATRAMVTDFDQTSDNDLSIEVTGMERVRLTGLEVNSAGIWEAKAEPLPEIGCLDSDEATELILTDLLNALLRHEWAKPFINWVDWNNPVQIVNYLVMLLPISPFIKQAILESDNISLRRKGVMLAISRLQEE